MSAPELVYQHVPLCIGQGSFGQVYKAIEKPTNRLVALKKSRVSLNIKKPFLEHEVNVLRVLSGHTAIPIVYGYGRMKHFEYISMELLGPTIRSCAQEGAGVCVITAARVIVQMLDALRHIHSLGILHRDIKPSNILTCLNDPSLIKLVDFGMAKPFCVEAVGEPSSPRTRKPVGTLDWASLNVHNGLEYGPRDDLESLAYTGLFLIRGNLPWRGNYSSQSHSHRRSWQIVKLMKQSCTSPPSSLSNGFPPQFSQLLHESRRLGSAGQIPGYSALVDSFAHLIPKGSKDSEPLDWTPTNPLTTNPLLQNGFFNKPLELDSENSNSNLESNEESDSEPTNSYSSGDISQWPVRQHERPGELVLTECLMARLRLLDEGGGFGVIREVGRVRVFPRVE